MTQATTQPPAQQHAHAPAFNEAQRILLSNYADGDFAYLLTDYPTIESFQQELARCGDGMLRFLLSELDDAEGCEDLATADERLDQAIDELNKMRVCITDAMDQRDVAIAQASSRPS